MTGSQVPVPKNVEPVLRTRAVVLLHWLFVAGSVATVGALYLEVGTAFAAVAAVGGLSVPLLRLLFPQQVESIAPLVRGALSRVVPSIVAAVLVWLCFFAIPIVSGRWSVALFVEKHQLRSAPKALSRDAVEQLARAKGFFDSGKNNSGKGLTNLLSLARENGVDVVKDAATGLVWEHGKREEFVSFEAAVERIKKMNQKQWGGHGTWRLPTLEEAYSILESSKQEVDTYLLYIDPVLGGSHPFVWTSDTDPDKGEPWILSYMSGDALVGVLNLVSHEYKFSVRAVRAERSGRAR